MVKSKVSKLAESTVKANTLGISAPEGHQIAPFGNGNVFVDDEGWGYELLQVTKDDKTTGYVMGQIAPEAADSCYELYFTTWLADRIFDQSDWEALRSVV